jgi:hypothetical protein
MRKVLVAILTAVSFLLAAPAWAQVSMVRVTSCGPAAFPGTVCTIPATTSGNLIVVAWQTAQANTGITISSVTDNAGNIYSSVGAARSIDTALSTVAEIWYAKNSQPGATSVTITPSSNVTRAGAVIWEFSGADPIAPLDQASALNSQASTATPSGAAVTTTSANEVVVSHALVANSVTGIHSGNAFINDSNLFSNGWAHLITSSTGTYAAQWDQSPTGTYTSGTASFRAASVGVSLNSCDLNQSGTVDAADVNLAVNMSLGLSPCTANIYGVGVCNVVVVQRVANAINGSCITGTGVTALSSLTCAPSTLTSGGLSTCTAALTNAAAGNTTVALSSNNASLTVPASVTVPSGLSSVTFTATAGTLNTNGSAIVTATLNGISSTSTIALTAPATPHSVTLNWTASTSTNVVGYNIYRGAVSGGPYTKLNSTPVAALTYTDNNVVAGQAYYYVATAVDNTNAESVYSSPPVPAVIPTP